MREIKFRCWDKLDKKMCVVGGIDWLRDKIVNVYRDKTRGWASDYIIEYKLMQYTGLKDENNQDVYEDDIIISGMDYCVVEYDNQTASFCLKNIKSELCECTFDDASFCVIGNIYENPELIK